MKKLKSLYSQQDTRNVLNSDANIFEREKFAREHQTTSENGSLKYTTTGNPFLDDFAKLSLYKEKRELDNIFDTIDSLWSHNPLRTLQLTVFLRLITRKTVMFTGEHLPTQRGQGLKHEFFGRLLWIGNRHSSVLIKNLEIFVAAGSWKDIFDLLRYDLSYNGIHNRMLDWESIIQFIIKYLDDPSQSNLIRKYLPQIVSKPKSLQEQCNSYIGKQIAINLFGVPEDNEEKGSIYRAYRKVKASGTAHDWQQKISQGSYDLIDFNTVAGRALKWMANSKFLENHGLEEGFYKWLLTQNTAKYTGYPYELFKDPISGYSSRYTVDPCVVYPKRYQRELINKQFLQLIETALNDMNRQTGYIVCMDVSGSMTSKVRGSETMSAYSVARAMALYFSYLLKGPFADTFLAFSNKVIIDKFEGQGPLDKYYRGYRKYDACNTNFFQIAQLFVDLKRKGYKESDFPTGVIVISDGEFDRQYGDWDITGRSSWERSNYTRETVFEAFKTLLRDNGFSQEYVDNFKMVLWDIPNSFYGSTHKQKFEALANTPNIFHMSGFDPAGIAFLTGTSNVQSIPRTPEELFEAAMSQEIIHRLQL